MDGFIRTHCAWFLLVKFVSIILCRLFITYFILPETEDRTLEDIELHFSDNTKSIFDHDIKCRKQAAKEKDTDQNKNTSHKNEAFVADETKWAPLPIRLKQIRNN